MSDLPSYNNKDENELEDVKLNKENAGNIMNFINTM